MSRVKQCHWVPLVQAVAFFAKNTKSAFAATLQILYIDTEGFESTTKANSYDDRIFALSTLLSSLLLYNLPETIRQSDISKLSFAVDLAQGFYERFHVSESARR